MRVAALVAHFATDLLDVAAQIHKLCLLIELDIADARIFLVDGAPRKNIATKVSTGTPWDDAYHTVRLVRDESTTKVYWDDEHVMTAGTTKFPTGRLAVGAFDDTGNFAEITVWGKKK